MAWIQSHQELGRHPKTARLARILDASRPCVVGHLHYLWWWALDFAQDGDLSAFDHAEIAEAAGWLGDGRKFVDALIRSGFADVSDDGALTLHDWSDYGGKLITQHQLNADKQRRWRERQHAQAPALEQSDPAPRNRHITVTSPLRNGPDKIRIDKKRERENVRADVRAGAGSVAATADHNEPLSLVVAAPGTPEPEPEADPAPTSSAPADATSDLLATLAADRAEAKAIGAALYGAWCDAIGREPRTTQERERWQGALAGLAHDIGLAPQDCASVVERYRKRFGADKRPTPGQVAAIFSQLEQETSTHGTDQHGSARYPAHHRQTPEERERDSEARLAAKQAGLTVMAAQLAAGQPDQVPPMPRPSPEPVDRVRHASA